MSDMPGMLDMNDMNPLMGLYSGGNNDDLGDDWDAITKDDFSFFDEVRMLTITAIVKSASRSERNPNDDHLNPL